MAYIRAKKINNALYGYLVESVSTKKGPRQKVKKYLGRIHSFKRGTAAEPKLVSAATRRDYLQQVVAQQLQIHGFKEKETTYRNDGISFSNLALKKGNKSVVLSLNDGHLCEFTVQRIAKFRKTKNLNADAHKLARYFLEAGLPVSQEQFVEFYSL
jgi:hypothetical protein